MGDEQMADPASVEARIALVAALIGEAHRRWSVLCRRDGGDPWTCRSVRPTQPSSWCESCVRAAVLAHVATLTEQRDVAQAELRTIDAVLARRSALEGIKTRAAKIEHACHVAGQVDPLTAKLELADTHNTSWARDYKSLAAKLDVADTRIAELEANYRRALEQMDTETARANGLGEINQQLGARARELEARVSSVVACAVRDSQVNPQFAGGLQPVIEMLRDALAAVSAPKTTLQTAKEPR